MSRPIALALLLSSCSGEPPPPVKTPASAPQAVASVKTKEERLSEYRIGDLNAFARGTMIEQGPAGRLGMLINGSRFVVDEGQVRGIPSRPREALSRVERIPAWLGGGLLFRAGSSLFKAESFDGELKPIITLPESITRISFGPKSVLVRGSDGGRWAFELSTANHLPAPKDPWAPNNTRTVPFSLNKNGRLPLTPIGLADIATLGSGPTLALIEGGAVLASINGGEAWTDITNRLSGAPVNIEVLGDKLFVTDTNGRAYKLESTLLLTEFTRLPSPPPVPKPGADPRWHTKSPPQELALTAGALIDTNTAVVAGSGDVATIDVRSGAITSIVQGRLPPNLVCEALRVPNDVLIVCGAPSSPSVVASGLLTEKGLHIERTFPSDRQFYADEEGTLVFGGPCSAEGSTPRTMFAACSRDSNGRWVEQTLERVALAAETDAKTKGVVEDVRWIPRRDKPPLAILVRTAITAIDPLSGEPVLWQMESLGSDSDALRTAVRSSRLGGAFRTGGPMIDRGWSTLPSGALRGWIRPGRAIEVSAKGGFTLSPFRFQSIAVSGPRALATSDNRLWQTLDRGVTWAEIAIPPSSNWSLRGCSMVGCDLGSWRRIGWEASIPDPKETQAFEESPPLLGRSTRVSLPEISCVPLGTTREVALLPSENSPSDRGLGASKIPISTTLPTGQEVRYRSMTFSRTFHNPPRTIRTADESSPFLMVHNFAVESAVIEGPTGTSNTLVVLGPSPSLASFKQTFTFVSPFDPTGVIHTPSLNANAFAVAARAAGITPDEALTNETEGEGFIPILPLEPGAPVDLFFVYHLPNADIAGILSGAGNSRVKLFGQKRPIGTPISAIALPGGEIAVLVDSADGNRRVLRLGANGTSEWSGASHTGSGDLQAANPDALAIGPDGSLGIVRTPSGEEPASIDDPALLLPLSPGSHPAASVPFSKVMALAPWSTLTSAASKECVGNGPGYRAIVQTKAPWVRLRGAPDDSNLGSVMMLAQVRWSTERVCLEALEIPTGITPVRDTGEMVTMTVAQFTSSTSNASSTLAPSKATTQANGGRIGFSLGAELRQALVCSIATP